MIKRQQEGKNRHLITQMSRKKHLRIVGKWEIRRKMGPGEGRQRERGRKERRRTARKTRVNKMDRQTDSSRLPHTLHTP